MTENSQRSFLVKIEVPISDFTKEQAMRSFRKNWKEHVLRAIWDIEEISQNKDFKLKYNYDPMNKKELNYVV